MASIVYPNVSQVQLQSDIAYLQGSHNLIGAVTGTTMLPIPNILQSANFVASQNIIVEIEFGFDNGVVPPNFRIGFGAPDSMESNPYTQVTRDFTSGVTGGYFNGTSTLTLTNGVDYDQAGLNCALIPASVGDFAMSGLTFSYSVHLTSSGTNPSLGYVV